MHIVNSLYKFKSCQVGLGQATEALQILFHPKLNEVITQETITWYQS